MKQKKSILFVLPEFSFGGTVFSTLNMISLLKEQYDIYVLAMSHQGPVKEKYSDVNILPENFMLASCCDAYRQISSVKKKVVATFIRCFEKATSIVGYDMRGVIYSACAKKYDGCFDYVACCQEGASTIFISKFKRSKKIAWFRSEYSVYKNQLTSKRLALETVSYHNVDKIVCVSKTTRDDMAKYFPELDDNIISIHNIQNCDNIIDKSKEIVTDAFDPKDFNIVSVGRFAPQKQFHLIPFIAAELKKQGLKFKWYIIGDGNQEGAYERFIDAMQSNSVDDYVFAIGSRLNPYPYISMANILVSTSYYEACPRVVAESKILHTPVVSANYSSAREFIVDGQTGIVDDVKNLPLVISQLIQNQSKYSLLKSNCVKYSMDNEGIMCQLKKLFI